MCPSQTCPSRQYYRSHKTGKTWHKPDANTGEAMADFDYTDCLWARETVYLARTEEHVRLTAAAGPSVARPVRLECSNEEIVDAVTVGVSG